jgi:hypothetical protein
MGGDKRTAESPGWIQIFFAVGELRRRGITEEAEGISGTRWAGEPDGP